MPKSKAINSIQTSDKEYLIANQVHDDSKSAVKIATTTATTTSNIPSTKTSTPSVNRMKMNRTVPSTGTANVKPNTIWSLEDRDIVVIDTADYKESTSTEATVIVVEKPRPYHHHQQQQQHQQQINKSQEIDLAQLLETNWPAAAGDLAVALSTRSMSSDDANPSNMIHSSGASTSSNSSSNYHLSSTSTPTTTVITERNRSKNPFAHLGQPKLRRNVIINAKTNPPPTTVNLINLDSDGSSSANEAHNQIAATVSSTENVYDNFPVPSTRNKSVQKNGMASPKQSDHLVQNNLDIGSMVEVSRENSENIYGVIRWIGLIPSTKILSVGIESEDEQEYQTNDDGAINGVRLFRCPPGRALFVQPEQCSVDRRFQDIRPSTTVQNKMNDTEKRQTENFGHMDCPIVEGSVPPLKMVKLQELENICGKFKGIQGHYNSCYLDATLFAMFTFTCVFDTLLFRPPTIDDIANYVEVQKVLREEIVNPLRKNQFVRADRVMKLRQLLEKLSSVTGLTCEEKDPEEFLNSLLTQIMKAEPFLKLNSGQDAFYYQLFVEKDERLSLPTVQQLFEQSFLASDIKLKEVPSCLIIQMPRFGKNFKMYPRILPSQVLDVTDVIEGSPRQCCVCGKLATLECKECFGSLQFGAGLESTSFCMQCLEKVHSHDKRTNHQPRELKVPQDFLIMAEHITVPRIFMELFAVVCIETSHYVAFVKCGSGLDAPWCFFDSMADRKGEQNGYNIPEVVSVPDLPLWLSEEGAKDLNERYLNDKLLPEHAKRLMCDAYMCMYQTDVMMYR